MKSKKFQIVKKSEYFKGNQYIFKSNSVQMKNKNIYEYEYIIKVAPQDKLNKPFILPIVKKKNEPHVILIANYRYIYENFCLELPSGHGKIEETMEETALR